MKIEKLKWTMAFLKKDIFKPKDDYVPTEKNILKEIVLNLTECPDCGYVFDNAVKSREAEEIIFIHSFARKRANCAVSIEQIRTGYHIRRASKIACGEIR